MEKRVASILLLLSVAVLFAAAAGSGDTDTIRLPSDGNGNDEEKPWECCNVLRCTRKQPPSCQCLDRVKQCSDTCKECVSVEAGREACTDWYIGKLPPRCDKDQEKNPVVVHGVVIGKEGGEERPPWKCCDRAFPGPSTTLTPVWYCLDKFEHCSCKGCVEVKDSSPSYFYCPDGYKGKDPGPRCTHDE